MAATGEWSGIHSKMTQVAQKAARNFPRLATKAPLAFSDTPATTTPVSSRIISILPMPWPVHRFQPCRQCNVPPRFGECALWRAASCEAVPESTCDQSRQKYCHCRSKTVRACDTGGRHPWFHEASIRTCDRQPKFFPRACILQSWLVQRFLLSTQPGIDGHHRLPRPIFQPMLLHDLAAARRRRLALIFWSVATPSLFK